MAVAARTALADVVHAGLSAAQIAFATPLPAEAMAILAARARTETLATNRLGSWTYTHLATLRVLPPKQRLPWLRQLLFPDLAHLRVRYGADGAGQGLAADVALLAKSRDNADRRAESTEARHAALVAKVEALADEWERNYASMLVGGFSGCSIGADTAAKRLRALLSDDAGMSA